MSTEKTSVETTNTPSCSCTVSGSFSTECKEIFLFQKHAFKEGKYYQDGWYFGDVIFSDEKIIQVECKNGNKYMEGQIITLKWVGF